MLDLRSLQPDDLGASYDNAGRLQAIEQALAASSDTTPFLLLPVRIETRFVQIERPLDQTHGIVLLTTALTPAAVAVEAIAGRDVATELTGTVKEKKTFKLKVEAPLYDELEQQIAAAGTAVGHAADVARSALVGGAPEVQALERVLSRLTNGLAGARASVAKLRSQYQREHFTELIDALATDAVPVENAIRGRTLPAAQLINGLRAVTPAHVQELLDKVDAGTRPARHGRAPSLDLWLGRTAESAHRLVRADDSELAALQRAASEVHSRLSPDAPGADVIAALRTPRPIPRSRLADSAQAYGSARGLIDALAAQPGPGAPGARASVEDAAASARDAITAAAGAAGQLRQIVIVPGDWKTSLLERTEAAVQRGDELASRVERGAAGGAPAGADREALAGELRSALGSLSDVARTVRSDDPALDAEAPPRRGGVIVVQPQQTELVDELWLRIYPDDVAVHTHEEALTESERDAGFAFWTEMMAAGSNEALQRAAWRALCAKHGSRRAAWIAQRTEPQQITVWPGAEPAAAIISALETLDKRIDEVASNWPNNRLGAIEQAATAVEKGVARTKSVPAPAFERISELITTIEAKLGGLRSPPDGPHPPLPKDSGAIAKLRESLDRFLNSVEVVRKPGKQPKWPDVQLKDGPWTQAPHSKVLPDRFLVVTVAGDQVTHAVVGEPVDPELKLGLDPDPANAAQEEFTLDADGNLTMGASIRWMADFDEALAKGMGVTIPLAPYEARDGFDRVYVLGVRTSTADAGRQLVEGLLDNHHYGQSGLSLVPVGTPTNNTEEQASGFTQRDDPDASFELERGAPLFDSTAPEDVAADGLRLARATGVDAARLAHVEHADGTDGADALLVNAVLWPGTVGHALEEELGLIFSVDTRERLKAFALAAVTARGLVPTLRVGAQPYGVLAATAYSRFVPASGDTLPAGVPQTEQEFQRRFDLVLRDVLLQMNDDWTRIRDDHVPHAYSTGVTDAQAHFLQMLGLQATSVTFGYRFAINCANRHPSSGEAQLDFGIPRSSEAALGSTADIGPVALLERYRRIAVEALDLGDDPVTDKGLVSATFADLYDRLLKSRVYRVRHVRYPKTLRGELVGTTPSDWIGTLIASDPVTLARHARRGDDGAGRPLLYLLLRQALLAAWREAALTILTEENMLTPAAREQAGESDWFFATTISDDAALTRWSFLFAPTSTLDGHLGLSFPSGPGTFYDYLRNHGDPAMSDYLAGRGTSALATGYHGPVSHEPAFEELDAHAQRASQLSSLPAPRLEQLVAEHVDLASHRLDAWLSGLAQQRLTEMRADAPQGVFLGAYGWVENLRPDAAHPLADHVPAVLDEDPSKPIHDDLRNEGFIHAPSITHATTAAILRGGYLAQVAQPDVDNRMAVNLSSRRVRVALELIDGVRAGNDLGSLLGYQLERHLHDAYATTGDTLDDLIAPMRRAFPSTVNVDGSLAAADTAERRVVDGLSLIQTVDAWVRANKQNAPSHTTLYELLADNGSFTGYPFGIVDEHGAPALPSLTTADGRARLDATLRALDAVADALDAVGDLVVSEAVHQIAQGNHARASASLAALTEGKAPPRPEIVDSAPRGTIVSQRLLLQLDPNTGGTLPAGWSAVPVTPRASAEPALNLWLGEALGPADDIRVRIVDEAGADVDEVTMADLQVQPADLLAMLGHGLEEGLPELSARVLDTHRPADVRDDALPAKLSVELRRNPAWTADVKCVLEAAPLLEAAGTLLSQARAADAHDFVLADTVDPATATATPSDTTELETRVGNALSALRGLGVQLLGVLSAGADTDPALLDGDPKAYVAKADDLFRTSAPDGTRAFKDLDVFWATRAGFFDALAATTAFGFAHSLPPTRLESREQTARDLLERAESAFVDVAKRLQTAGASLGEASTAARPARALGDAAGAVFGATFTVLPQFTLANGGEVADGLAAGIVDDPDVTLDAWLSGVAAVRPAAGSLAEALLLGDVIGGADVPARALQLPQVDGDPWLGDEFPADIQPSTDKLSLVVFGSDNLAAPGGANAGLLVDHWDESIPDSDQLTGVAFNYDQPDSTPPQTLLLAVPPDRQGKWLLEDLVQTLHETLELAKNRAVELEHLGGDVYGQLLPAVFAELLPKRMEGAGDDLLGSRAILDFGVNNQAVPN